MPLPIGPLKFNPIFKERIWGSRRLEELYGKALPAGVAIGESWELADLGEDCSCVSEGPLACASLRRLLAERYDDIGFSMAEAAEPFGLLIKVLASEDSLSVQVHPDLEACREIPGAALKTECWYVLRAEPGALIYRGFRAGVGMGDLKDALGAGSVDKLLRSYPAEIGQFYMMPAGTVHALGAGIVIAEIQTPSDTTYRLFDWNRTDGQGRSRELHIEQALRSVRFPEGTPPTAGLGGPTAGEGLLRVGNQLGQAELLVDCSYFAVVHVRSNKAEVVEFAAERPFVAMGLKGCGVIMADGICCSYRPTDTILIPKTANGMVKPEQAGELLLTCLGCG